MEKRTIHFSGPIWTRLQALATKEDAPVADVMRRILATGLGLDEEALAAVQFDQDAGDVLPKLKREVLAEKIARNKLANKLARLEIDLQDLADADQARRDVWEGMKARSEALFRQTAQTQAVLYQGLLDVRKECEALRAGLTTLGEDHTKVAAILTALQQVSERLTTLDETQQTLADTQANLHEVDMALQQRQEHLLQMMKRASSFFLSVEYRMQALEGGDVDAETVIDLRAKGRQFLEAVESDAIALDAQRLTQPHRTDERGEHE